MVYLTRRVEFEASHYYWLAELSPDENRERFGPNVHRHGHNYTLKVRVEGHVDARDGMVINIKDIDRLLRKEILKRYDHQLINEQHPTFLRQLPTTENLARVMWSEIMPQLTGCMLNKVRLYESPTLYADYLGEDRMVTLTRVYGFSASHRLQLPSTH